MSRGLPTDRGSMDKASAFRLTGPSAKYLIQSPHFCVDTSVLLVRRKTCHTWVGNFVLAMMKYQSAAREEVGTKPLSCLMAMKARPGACIPVRTNGLVAQDASKGPSGASSPGPFGASSPG
eukprot:3490650-Pleurochrysis_carterae.AAC.3